MNDKLRELASKWPHDGIDGLGNPFDIDPSLGDEIYGKFHRKDCRRCALEVALNAQPSPVVVEKRYDWAGKAKKLMHYFYLQAGPDSRAQIAIGNALKEAFDAGASPSVEQASLTATEAVMRSDLKAGYVSE